MSNLLLWRKAKKLFHKNKYKKKLIFIFSTAFLLTLIIYGTSLQTKVATLQKEKRDNELRLNVLGASAASTKEKLQEYYDTMKHLDERVDRIITHGTEDVSTTSFSQPVQPTDTPSNKTTNNVSTSNSSNTTTTSFPTTISPTSAQITSGTVTAYASSGKTVPIYKEGSTISPVLTQVSVGTSLNVIKKGSEWYQVQYDDKSGWIQTKHIQTGL